MIIGVPREIKADEYRVSMTPAGVKQLVDHGHRVLVEAGAGKGTGIEDRDYTEAGAGIAPDAGTVFAHADLVVKVKEPQPSEWPLLRAGQALFTYFHFASSRSLLQAMLDRQVTCIAYETVRTRDGQLPLLQPMSEVAGRLAVQEGAKYLEEPQRGRGVLLSGVPGVEPGIVVIIGGGIVGYNAARAAAGIGATVYVLDISWERIRYLDTILPANVCVLHNDEYVLRDMLRRADLVIGAVLVPGAAAPKVIRRDMLALMKRGSVIVDVAVDHGGCCETTRPTTHQDPVYVVDDVVHYCVPNMPGAVPRTSTYALANATTPYLLAIADKGVRRAAAEDSALLQGINAVAGVLTCQPVADTFGMPCSDPLPLL